MNIFSYLISLDHQVSVSMLSIRSPFWDSFFLAVTRLGTWQAITLFFIAVSIALWIYKKRSMIFPLFLAAAGSGIMTVIVKYWVDRTRPDVSLAVYLEYGPSFPSAHAVLIMAFFGFLIYLLWKLDRNLDVGRLKSIMKIGLSVIFVLVILLVGFSRLYLGVHYLTDVLAGYLVGLLWVLVSIYISRQHHPSLE